MDRSLRRFAKETAGRLLFATGLEHRLLRGKALIVAFHTIGEHGEKNSIQVTPKLFREYCAHFRRYFDVVPLTALLDDLEAGRDVSRKLVITFDDGYKDNYTHAAPALESTGLPATFFIATDFIGSTNVPWWDEDSGVRSEWMSWDDVIDLHRRGFDIGAHTQSHPNLRFSSAEGAREEIEGSKAVIEERLGGPIAHFAYPYGRRSDISEPVRELVAEAGFRCCLSCFGGVAGQDTKFLDLPRIPVNDWYGSPYQFGLDAVRDVKAAGGEYDEVEPFDGRVLIASYHLYPDAAVGARRPSELMRHLAAKGYAVDAIGGRLGRNDTQDAALAARLEDFKIMRVPQPPSVTDRVWKHAKALWAALMRRSDPEKRSEPVVGNAITAADEITREPPWDWLRRQYNAMYSLYDAHKVWALLALLRLVFVRLGRRYDIVVSSGPPSASHLVGWVAAKWSGSRYVMDFRDPWVGNAHVSPSSTSRFRQWLENTAERACVHRAEVIAVTTPGIERMLAKRYPDQAAKIRVIYNGYDGEPTPPPVEPPGRMDMLYAGTLYMNRNPFPLLETLKVFVDEPGVERDKVSLTFVGDCETWNGRSLRDWVDRNAMTDIVRILPPLTRLEIDELTAKSTVLINLAQGQPDQIPAKTFDYIASGKHMIVLAENDSDTASLVSRTSRCAVCDGDRLPPIAKVFHTCYEELRGCSPMAESGLRDAVQYSRSAQFDRLADAMNIGYAAERSDEPS